MFEGIKKLIDSDELSAQISGINHDTQQMYKTRAANVRGQVSEMLMNIYHNNKRIEAIENHHLNDDLNTPRDNYLLKRELVQLKENNIHTRKRIFVVLGSLQHIAKAYNIENIDVIDEIQQHADTYLKGTKFNFKALLK